MKKFISFVLAIITVSCFGFISIYAYDGNFKVEELAQEVGIHKMSSEEEQKWMPSVSEEKMNENEGKYPISKEFIEEALKQKTVYIEERPDGLFDVYKENGMVLVYDANPEKNEKAQIVTTMVVVETLDDSGL